MSMASMLTKMVVAGLVAKGVGKVMGRGSSSGGGLGDVLGGLLGGGNQSQSGGLGAALGGMLGGNNRQSGGGLSDLLGSLSGGASQGGKGFGDLGSLLGGGQSQGGGANIGDLLSQLGGGSQQGGIGDLLGSVLGGGGLAAAAQATPDQDQQAELLLRAMINAAKSDGEIDRAEQQKLLEHLGDVSEEEANFLRSEMGKPVDTDALVRSVPRGMEQQVYFISLTAIDLDCKPEAQYLHNLAQGLNLSSDVVNRIHQQVGAPLLYA